MENAVGDGGDRPDFEDDRLKPPHLRMPKKEKMKKSTRERHRNWGVISSKKETGG